MEKNIYPIGLLARLNEIISVKCLDQWLPKVVGTYIYIIYVRVYYIYKYTMSSSRLRQQPAPPRFPLARPC